MRMTEYGRAASSSMASASSQPIPVPRRAQHVPCSYSSYPSVLQHIPGPYQCCVTAYTILIPVLCHRPYQGFTMVHIRPISVLCHSLYHAHTNALPQTIPMPLSERISCSYQCNVTAHTMRSPGLYHSQYLAHTTLECL